MKKLLLLLFIFHQWNFLLSQEVTEIDIITGLKNSKKLNLSDIAFDVDYIFLETLNTNLISYIDQIKISDEFLVVETFNPGEIFSFNYDGKFLKKIGKQGRGPKEYNFLAGFGINEKSNEVYIYGLEPSKILVFDINGSYKRSLQYNTSYPDEVHEIEFIAKDTFVKMEIAGGKTPFSYVLFSNDTIVKKAIIPKSFQNGSLVRVNEYSFYHRNKNLYVKENLLNDTLYKIAPSLNFEPVYIFKTGKYSCPVELRQNFIAYFEKEDFKYFMLNRIFETNKLLIFFFSFDKNLYHGYYNKTSKVICTFKSEGICNNFDGGPDFLPMYQKENLLIGYVNVFQLKKHVDSDAFKNSTPKYPEKKNELERLANSLNENDNPVLMLVKLKD